MSSKSILSNRVNAQIWFLVLCGWVSTGLCHAVRHAARWVTRHEPLDNMPLTMVSLLFAFLAVAFALFFALKATYLCVRQSRTEGPQIFMRKRSFALIAAWLPAGYYGSFWIYVLSNGRWMEWVARI